LNQAHEIPDIIILEDFKTKVTTTVNEMRRNGFKIFLQSKKPSLLEESNQDWLVVDQHQGVS
jgi:hypothetical protein